MKILIDIDDLYSALEQECFDDPYIANMFKMIASDYNTKNAVALTLKAMAARAKSQQTTLETIMKNIPYNNMIRKG